MLRVLIAAVVIAASAYFGYLHKLSVAPIEDMERLERNSVGNIGGYNITARSFVRRNVKTTVPSSNPDTLTVSCIYNLSKGPVRIYGATSPYYWSLSLYAHNTDNYFVVNDRELPSDHFSYLLVTDDMTAPDSDGAEIIRSPTKTGVVLMRYFVPTDEDVADISERMRQSGCEGPKIAP